MSLTPEDTIKTAIQEAEAVIVGIGSEFSVKPSEVIKENELYNIYQKLSENEQADDVTKQYMIYSIYYHELLSGRNNVVLSYQQAYENLKAVLTEKNYFLVTTCTDDIVYYTGLDKEKIVAPCGSILRLQEPCDCGKEEVQDLTVIQASQIYEKLYDAIARQDISAVKDAIPRCTNCNAPMLFNVHGAKNYNENGYIMQWNKYTGWLQRTLNKKLVLLELGVDFSVPTVIRWPFEKVAMLNYKAMLYRINAKFPQLPEEAKNKGMSVNENSLDFVNREFLS